jgi:hypothetical protein
MRGGAHPVRKFDPVARAAEKQAARDRDADRLRSGAVQADALARENDFFRGIEIDKFKIAAIGGRPLGR